MPYHVKLPDIGEGIAEGEIVRWMVKPGDAVKEDQPLVEVMTDKASVEIPSPRTGVIAALLAEEGQMVPVGTAIVSITLAGESAPPGPVAPPAPPAYVDTGSDADGARWNNEGGAIAPAADAPATVPRPGGGRAQATPAVRKLAKQLGVAIDSVTGTGPGGTVTAADLHRVSGAAVVVRAPKVRKGTMPTVQLSSLLGPPAPIAASAPEPDEPEERVPLRGLRRVIAEHMRHSLDVAAHFTFVAECDLTEVVEHRAQLKARAEAAGIKLTYLAYVLKALLEPLQRYPYLNASLDDEKREIVLRRYYHLGIATATPEGLTVPVIHHADRFSLFGLAREAQRLSEGARAGTLKLEEHRGGTFTITSTGARGGLLATPIVHHPQVAILGVHEVKKRPAVLHGQIVARDLTNLSLSLDHRVVDGAVGADFLYEVIERLQRPATWLTEADFA